LAKKSYKKTSKIALILLTIVDKVSTFAARLK